MRSNGRIGLSGVDTRALTRRIRERGAPNGVIAHDAGGVFDIDALIEQARAWPGLEGMDLARRCPAADVPLVGRRLEAGRRLCRACRGREPPARGRDRLRLQAQHLPQPRRCRARA
jgi:carbamoylphosphate synthase small subunit